MINPQNGDEECFKWAIIAVDKWMDIDFHPERVSNLREFADNYDWSGLEFPVSLKQIGKFEAKNNISITGVSISSNCMRIQFLFQRHNFNVTDLLLKTVEQKVVTFFL